MAPSHGHIPERTCAGCRRKGRKDSFIRVVRTACEVVVDRDGLAQGRGAYICRSAECLAKARKKRALGRTLRVVEGNIPYETLSSAVEQCDPVDG